MKLVNEEMDKATTEYKEKLREIAEELADVKRRLDRYYEALETGLISLNDRHPEYMSYATGRSNWRRPRRNSKGNWRIGRLSWRATRWLSAM